MAFATSFVRDCCSSGQHEPLNLAMSVSLRCSTSNMFSEANVDFYQQEHLVISGITITEVYVIGPSQIMKVQNSFHWVYKQPTRPRYGEDGFLINSSSSQLA